MSHTPGPWKVVGTEIWAGSRRITTGRGAYDEKDRVVRDANARLIAAAPELLRAAKLALGFLEGSHIDPESGTLLALRAAIAKVEP